MSRRLIVNADDFGASVSVNEAVEQAFSEGVLRFASLMVDGPAAQDAAKRARRLPGLGVGVHLALSSEAPAAWGLRLLSDRNLRRGLPALIESQIQRCLALGIRPTHLDSHWNAHVHPLVFPEVARAAARHGIGRVRWPGGEFFPSAGYALRRGPLRLGVLAGQAALAGVYLGLGAFLKGRFPGTVRAWGMLRSGLMSEDYAIWLLRRLPEGLTELYFHPSGDRDAVVSDRPTADHRSFTELQTLLSPRVRQALREQGIGLVSRDG